MTEAGEFFHPDAALAMRVEIAATGGNEVFFVGRRSPEFPVAEVQVLARGHGSAVPAVLRSVRAGEVVLHNHPSGQLMPSEADLAIASGVGASGIAFAIVDNDVTRAYVVVEPQALREVVRIDPAEVGEMLGPSGAIARRLPGYEHRDPQIAMAKAVTRAFNGDRIALIEAGTGTGKSLAYLLPAILFATRNRERVVISTNTINLQEQLVGKDLPFLREQLGLEFKSVLLKGRSNYVCLRKADFARRERERLFAEPQRASLDALSSWIEKTADGSRSDLGFEVPPEVWEEVASDSDDCLRVKSPFFGRCFFFQSRREAASADIVVVNHHLLMADLAARAASGDYSGTAVLPPYDRIVIDEAHHLEDVASSYFGSQLTALGLLKSLGRLQPEKDERRGVLSTLHERVETVPALEELVAEAREARKSLGIEVRARFLEIATAALGWLGLDEPGSEEIKVRLTAEVLSHPAMAEGLVPACQSLTRSLGAYVSLLQRLRTRVGADLAPDESLNSALLRIEAVRKRLDGAAEELAAFPALAEGSCRWVEVRRTRGGETMARIAAAPLEAGPLLARYVHQRMKTVVMTSATLTVGKRFDHYRTRLGVAQVPSARVGSARFESPFDFDRQALVVVARDMPDPAEPAFADAVCQMVGEAVKISRGRAFVLFTSYRLLARVFAALEGRLRGDGLSPLKQGTAPRDQLLQRFRREAGSVLFAVDSFWEGVDVPGQALSLVILVRLPFKVPTEPLQEARFEAIENSGGDPFLDYAVPQAVIKFRQGFGRLIRTRDDRGAVLILDPRVTTRAYGRPFLDSLPELRVVSAARPEALSELSGFFSAMAQS